MHSNDHLEIATYLEATRIDKNKKADLQPFYLSLTQFIDQFQHKIFHR